MFCEPLKLLLSTDSISILHQLSKKLIAGSKVHSLPLLLWFMFHQEIDGEIFAKSENDNKFYKRIQCCVIINLLTGWLFQYYSYVIKSFSKLL